MDILERAIHVRGGLFLVCMQMAQTVTIIHSSYSSSGQTTWGSPLINV